MYKDRYSSYSSFPTYISYLYLILNSNNCKDKKVTRHPIAISYVDSVKCARGISVKTEKFPCRLAFVIKDIEYYFLIILVFISTKR